MTPEELADERLRFRLGAQAQLQGVEGALAKVVRQRIDAIEARRRERIKWLDERLANILAERSDGGT